MALLRRGYIRDGRFIEETARDRKWQKFLRYCKKQELMPTKEKCPSCGKKMDIYMMEEEYDFYRCLYCSKKFKRREEV